MKILLLIPIFLFTFSFKTKAQYVTIPDPHLAAELALNYPNCINGNQLDISCIDIPTATSIMLLDDQITNLDGIQYFTNLQELYCWGLSVSVISSLPNSVTYLELADMNISSLSVFPPNLETIVFNTCNMSAFPQLPNSLEEIYFLHGNLTGIITLPDSLRIFDCQDNYITAFTNFPSTLTSLHCGDNDISCFPAFPSGLQTISLVGNPFHCLPNYLPVMNTTLLSYPLCVYGDQTTNPNGCPDGNGIAGKLYGDTTNDCQFNSYEPLYKNIPLKLYDSGGNFLMQTYSTTSGLYGLSSGVGNFKVELDTLDRPYTVDCATPGIDSSFSLSASNPFISGVDFSIKCNQELDLGIQSVMFLGVVFPGDPHTLKINAGDLSQWYNLNCLTGHSGVLDVIIHGNASYLSPKNGAFTPVVSGDTLHYSISDFGTIDNSMAFNIILQTDTTAQIGDSICVTIQINSAANEINIQNNTYDFCYAVGASYDPNKKEVYPVNVEPAYEDWFTYTVHFQNTGTSPAHNILLLDTLDTNLNHETFQVINYSHENTTTLANGVVKFKFMNIMLPDSVSDPTGSMGFIQYRVKPKPALPAGTQINNTAYIYFDYNSPIVTNTTVNSFVSPLSINSTNNSGVKVQVFPNPTSGSFTVKGKAIKSIRVSNLLGLELQNKQVNDNYSEIDLTNLPNGMYLLQIETETGRATELVIKN